MESTTSSAASLQCVVVTPERAVLDEQADFVAVPMYDGELGVLPGRAPLIGRLGYGELRTVRGNQTKRFFIDGGFVQIRSNTVTVLTPRALTAEEIQPDAVVEKLKSAQKPAPTLEAQEAQLKDQMRARAQLRIARKLHPEDEL
ncbi:MAG: ATP synthase F1 subunit epsilon [Gemmataceae bacterium]|nr:ATP synthase F1 subunit epsilon [Gemmataceae bacterium]MCI0739767.1 ATP synthase F1 subunit epsilon [Gemmataceae bacterium]